MLSQNMPPQEKKIHSPNPATAESQTNAFLKDNAPLPKAQRRASASPPRSSRRDGEITKCHLLEEQYLEEQYLTRSLR